MSAPLNTPCKLYVYKDITVKKYAVYKKFELTSGDWTFDHYEYITSSGKNYLEVRSV